MCVYTYSKVNKNKCFIASYKTITKLILEIKDKLTYRNTLSKYFLNIYYTINRAKVTNLMLKEYLV